MENSNIQIRTDYNQSCYNVAIQNSCYNAALFKNVGYQHYSYKQKQGTVKINGEVNKFLTFFFLAMEWLAKIKRHNAVILY